MLQIDVELLNELHDYGFRIAVESNGTVNPGKEALNMVDHLCISPKLSSKGIPLELKVFEANELKVVLPGFSSASWNNVGWSDEALELIKTEGEWGALIVQPQDPKKMGNSSFPGSLSASVKRCLTFVKEHPEWRLGVQTQKVLDIA